MSYMTSSLCALIKLFFFFFSSRRRHTRCSRDWSSDVCSSDLLLTEVGLLEIRGKIHRIRAETGSVVGSPERLGSGFAVEFEPLDETKAALLASLLDGLRERSTSVKVTGLLKPQTTSRLLLEASAPST